METETTARTPGPAPRRRFTLALVLAAAALGGGMAGWGLHGRGTVVVALSPGPIDRMRDGSPVALKGEVADLFGQDFVLQDSTGRALIDTGPEGAGGGLVAKSETVTIQGRFDRGIVHAVAISHADGRTDVVGPPGPPPPPGLAGWFGRHGPRG